MFLVFLSYGLALVFVILFTYLASPTRGEARDTRSNVTAMRVSLMASIMFIMIGLVLLAILAIERGTIRLHW